MVKMDKRIDAYISELPDWSKKICERLRKIIHRADPDIVEDWKWNAPCFVHSGIVCWFWAFKNWVTFTFYYGSLIDDRYKLFNYGFEHLHNRSIKLTDVGQIKEKEIIEYLKEAVENNLVGKRPQVQRVVRKATVMPYGDEVERKGAKLSHLEGVQIHLRAAAIRARTSALVKTDRLG